jgi:hypothetical protein
MKHSPSPKPGRQRPPSGPDVLMPPGVLGPHALWLTRWRARESELGHLACKSWTASRPRPSPVAPIGEGLFPADYTCLPCLLIRLAAQGLAPLLCARCHGVVDLIPRPALPEVTRHVHD